MSRSIEEIDKIVSIVLEDQDVMDELNRRMLQRYDEWVIKRVGYKEGERETKERLAKKLLKEKVDIDTIVEFTELSKEEIEKLK